MRLRWLPVIKKLIDGAAITSLWDWRAIYSPENLYTVAFYYHIVSIESAGILPTSS